MTAIGRGAMVSPETIYARFGNKRTIAHELIIRAMRGAQQDVPFMQQTQRVSVVQQPNGDHIIRSFAVDIAKVLTRVAPILSVIRSAAETDPEMVACYRELHQTRRRNLGRVVDALQERDLLRAGVTVEEAKDTLWSVVSPELWLLREGQLGTSE